MSSIGQQLLSVETSPALLCLETDVRAAAELAPGWANTGLAVRAVRGRKTRTREALFNEFAAALQFPYYFGENWPAFNECLADLEWISAPAGIVILVYEAAQLLEDEHPGDMAVLVKAINNAGTTFGQPVADGEWWDRPAVPFHVVLQEESVRALGRWELAGARLEPVEPNNGWR
jgi:RNAse (barnase) inhibitor barstar